MRFVTRGTFDIIAPGLIEKNWSEADVLGSAVWLWMHSQSHGDLPLHTLSALLLPAIKHRQFILASEAGRPVFYLAWANLSPEAEQRYLEQHSLCIAEEDWDSGDRAWILDWIAPFGHSHSMKRLLSRQLLANRCMRSLYHRGDDRVSKIKTFRGKAISRRDAKAWFDARPVMHRSTYFSPAYISCRS